MGDRKISLRVGRSREDELRRGCRASIAPTLNKEQGGRGTYGSDQRIPVLMNVLHYL